MMKRICCLLLAVLLLLAALPLSASAASKKLVALTFDDGPGAYTARLLDGLKARGAKATFFMLGSCASGYPSIVKRAYDEGHQIACHSWDHPDLTGLGDDSLRSQFTRSYSVLDQACGAGTSYLTRSPYGSENSRVLSVVGTPFIYWSVDPQDWLDRDSSIVSSRITGSSFDGAIILVHDIHSTSVDGALAAIDVMKSRGYEFVTVNELFRRRGLTLSPGQSYRSCPATGKDTGALTAPKITYTTVGSETMVTITAQAGVPIYYNTDGSSFKKGSRLYQGPFSVKLPCTVSAAAAYNLNGGRSPTAQLKITKKACAAPEAVIEDGVLFLTNKTDGASLYYTTGTALPSVESLPYTEPIPLEPGTAVHAIAGGKEFLPSASADLYYSPLENVFSDVFPESWYCESIDRAASMKILNGVGGYSFAPKKKLSRGMLVTMLYRLAGEPLEEGWTRTNRYEDVPVDQYYAPAVEWAYRTEIAKGYSDTQFSPKKNVTRQEICIMLDAFLKWREKPLLPGKDCASGFTDGSRISGWAKPQVDRVVAAGLLQGDAAGTLRPRGEANRAEAASILIRLMDYEEGYVPQEVPEEQPGEAPEEAAEETEEEAPEEEQEELTESGPEAARLELVPEEQFKDASDGEA